MTTTAPRTEAVAPVASTTSALDRLVSLGWVRRHEWAWLWAIAAIATVARVSGLSGGTLFRDDAWVALTTRVSLGTAARMVVTTPGFVLGERAWIGWFPHTVWADQLPTLVASVAGVVVVGRLARWWGLSAPASLVAAGLVAVSASDVVYATRIKPYAFDLLGACLVLWLAERVRRGGTGAPWLAVASVAVCCVSLTPVPLVLGVWAALVADALARRRWSGALLASGAGTAIGLGALWLAVRGDVSPRLRTSWDGYYLVVSSAHGLAHTARAILDGLVAGVGVTTPDLGLRGLGTLDRVAIFALFVVGLVRWRRQLLPLAALAAAIVLSVPRFVPLGTGRTDAYLYPAIAMVLAEGAALTWRAARRGGRTVAIAALAAAVVFGGLLATDRLVHRPTYPGGDFGAVSAVISDAVRQGGLVVIGGSARWPWAYYDAPRVAIVYSDLYNNGYYPMGTDPSVLVLRGSAIEGGYAADVHGVALAVRHACAGVTYVEVGDWPSMSTGLLRALTTTGGRTVASGPRDVGGYRVWTLEPTRPCLREGGSTTGP